MNTSELVRFTSTSAVSHRLRSGLTALGIAIGVAAVVLLTSMGEGLRVYMVAQFTQFGTNIVGVNPGKAQTFGMPTGVLNSARPLSLADAQALRGCPACGRCCPWSRVRPRWRAAAASARRSSAAPATS